jgi:hypothetical protein
MYLPSAGAACAGVAVINVISIPDTTLVAAILGQIFNSASSLHLPGKPGLTALPLLS